MEKIIEYINSLGPAKNYIIIIVMFWVVGIILAVISKKRLNKKASTWKEEHPNYSKVYFSNRSDVLHSNAICADIIDGEEIRKDTLASSFIEGVNMGFYTTPGTHEVEVRFTTTRPGILHKRVTKTYGPVKIEIELEAEKSYNLYFDMKEENFVLEER